MPCGRQLAKQIVRISFSITFWVSQQKLKTHVTLCVLCVLCVLCELCGLNCGFQVDPKIPAVKKILTNPAGMMTARHHFLITATSSRKQYSTALLRRCQSEQPPIYRAYCCCKLYLPLPYCPHELTLRLFLIFCRGRHIPAESSSINSSCR